MDQYLEVKADNSVFIRGCTVNSGYAVIEEGRVNEDTLLVGDMSFALSSTGDGINMTYQNNSMNFTSVLSIPTSCENDAIEITSLTPTTATDGMSTLFTINVDYRLVSKSNGIVYLGFNTSSASAYTLTGSTINVNQKGLASGSITATVIPIYYTNPNNFKAYVNLSEFPHSTPWTPLASHTKTVSVSQNNAANLFSRLNTSIFSKQDRGYWLMCSTNAFFVCENNVN